MPEKALMCTIGSRVPGLYSFIGENLLGGDSRVLRYVEVVWVASLGISRGGVRRASLLRGDLLLKRCCGSSMLLGLAIFSSVKIFRSSQDSLVG